MREILFRAKRLDNGEWVEGYFYIDLDDGPVITLALHDCGSSDRMPCDYQRTDRIDPSALCQFTGLRDKNGERIWEGDRLKWSDGYEHQSYTGIVFYSEEDAAFLSRNEKHSFSTDRLKPYDSGGATTYRFTRLGSIHDKEQP